MDRIRPRGWLGNLAMVMTSAALVLCLVSISEADVAPNTAAGAPTALKTAGFPNYFRMVVDDAHNRVFLSPGPGGTKLRIMGFGGNAAGTLDIPGASGMTIIDDILYVAAFDADRIEKWNLTTDPPTKISDLSTSPYAHPRDLVTAGGKLVFTTNCGQWDGQLALMGTNGSGMSEYSMVYGGSWSYCPVLDAGVESPNEFFVQSTGISPSTLYEFKVAGGAIAYVTESDFGWGHFGGSDVAIMPGGTNFLMGSTTAAGAATYKMSDLSGPQDNYLDPTANGSAVAATPANGGLIAAAGSTWPTARVVMWNMGQTAEAMGHIDLDESQESIRTRGLEFSSDGAHLFVVSSTAEDSFFYSLDPTRISPSLTLTTDTYIQTFGKKATLSGVLVGGDTNRTVEIWAEPHGGPPTLVDTLTAGSDGAFSSVVTIKATTVFTARYAGDASFLSSSSSDVWVSARALVKGKMRQSFKKQGKWSLYHVRQRVNYQTIVLPDRTGSDVTITLQYLRSPGKWHTMGSADFQLRKGSSITVFLDVSKWPTGVKARFSSDYPDEDFLSGDHSSWSYFQVVP